MPRILDFADGFQSSTDPTSVPFPASQVGVTPSGNLSSTNAQSALVELQGDVDTLNNKLGAANGIATLDASAKIPVSQIPAIALVDVYVVANIAARDALTVQAGDVAQVTDAGGGVTETYQYNGTSWTDLKSNIALAAHQSSTTAHAASAITNTPSGSLAATNVQSALNELQSDIDSRQTAGNYITALTGDVTASGPGSVSSTIANDAVTNAKAANMATQTIKGRTSSGTGDPEDLTAAQATAILNAFVGDSGSGGTKGLVPAPSTGDASKFLQANGTWGTPSGAAQAPGFRNRIINGGMAVDERNDGASQTFTAGSAVSYCVDRFYAYCTGANVTGQRVSGSGQTKYLYQFTGAASVTKIGFGQRIEDIYSYDLNNGSATISVAMSNSLLTTVTWVASYANSANNFGAVTQIATGTFTVNSTLTTYNATISVPSAATTGIQIEFSVAAQTSGTWKIGNVQLEPGSSVTAFEQRPLTIEETLCQRYLPSVRARGTTNVPIGHGIGLGTSSSAFRIFPVRARIPPTGISVSSGSHFGLYTGGTQTSSAIAFNSAGPEGCWLIVTTPAITNGYGVPFYFVNASGYLLFTGCEL